MAKKTQEVKTELEPGVLLQVFSSNNALLFQGRVGRVRGKAVRISDIAGEPLPPVLYNTEVKLKAVLPGMRIMILNGVVTGSTPEFWQIEQVGGKKSDDRNFFRQKISVAAQVLCANGIFKPGSPVESEGVFPCTLQDISGGGIRLITKAKYRAGDWLLVSQADILENGKPFTFTCEVRRADNQGVYGTIYGCQFREMEEDEQDRVIEAIFLLQRREAQRRNSAR